MIIFVVVWASYSTICSAQNNKTIKSSEETSVIYVYDYEEIFTKEEKDILSEIINKYTKQSKKEILVVTTPSIGDFSDIQEYANNIGSIYSNSVKNENIVTIAISKTLRKIGIATSPKARESLTDKISLDIINEIMIPEIKQGFFYKGTRFGINEIINRWDVE